LRNFFSSSLKIELNETLSPLDTLALKRRVFFSGITLFNLSLLSVYGAFRIASSPGTINGVSRMLLIPLIMGAFTVGVYKIGLQWLNR
jgi:hypothetical protein